MEFLATLALAFQMYSYGLDYQASNRSRSITTCAEWNTAADCKHNRKYMERPTW